MNRGLTSEREMRETIDSLYGEGYWEATRPERERNRAAERERKEGIVAQLLEAIGYTQALVASTSDMAPPHRLLVAIDVVRHEIGLEIGGRLEAVGLDEAIQELVDAGIAVVNEDGEAPAAATSWQHCSPTLLASGVDCASTTRRACECESLGYVGHDHLVSASSPEGR